MTHPILLILGFIILTGFYLGRNMRFIKLPSIIGYMLLGVVLGSSLLNILSDVLLDNLDFISSIALGFVAFSIGLELKISHLRRLGKGIIYIILMESFGAFILVFVSLQLLTGDTALSLLFAAIAPASAPAGTVAVIREYKAKGVLTKALYAVVGFDDGLGIVIFGFASAFAQSILSKEAGNADPGIMITLLQPLKEVALSILCGGVLAFLSSILIRRLKVSSDVFIVIFGIIFLSCGICEILHLSEILTIMVMGMIMVNMQSANLVNKIQNELGVAMPLLFILFFTLAGANLHISAIPALGLLGLVYIFARSAGLIFGSKLGAALGKAPPVISKYIGMGILSQAGVAIGLSLLIKQNYAGLGAIVDRAQGLTHGDIIGITVITTVTATSIVFEIIGPILTKIALTKAGEIKVNEPEK
ncbi:MAG: cation:proton antiporter [Candidatus Stygibacter australis]|nr:cation:proton antiporter [Candidatus Stygibacter australis]MDP8322608.1 cation:proton antiporter [Candidatus Stygibacter australis]